ncbi:hypothetical protein KTJ34_15470 [Acinetobacter courvalinii]|uniref:ATP-binding cassette domain-containing protein n=1 Tax=Acinetobacter courvalinii TaxID=280147 RepID=UPI0021D09E35|nr:hypothetical protein [Acinetobacter courvalinii]MCU4578822.1 hypothetical protein [Acinetobacter courvalinii]
MPNLRFILFQAILSKYGFITTFLIVIQQILSASSVIFLTKAISSIDNTSELMKNIIIFFVLVVVPYIPVCIAQVTMYKVVNSTHCEIIKKNISLLRYNTSLLNSSVKDRFVSNLSRNSFMIINDYFVYVYRVVSLILNVFFTIIIISSLISKEYLYSFVFSLMLSYLFFYYVRSKIEKSSVVVENDLVSYASIIERSWNNLILGSKLNLFFYNDLIEKESKKYYSSKLNNAFIQQVSNFVSAIIALVPLSVVSIYLIFENININILLSAILVNLTRMVGLFSFLGTLIYDITNFVHIKSRIKNMIDSLSVVEYRSNIEGRSLKPLYFNGSVVESYDFILSEIEKVRNGRFTITGENGSGKTTLLYYLLEKYKENSIFIPTSPGDLEWGENIKGLSTGQQVFSVVSSKIYQCDENIILLDEWDANLDLKNTIELNNLLENISKNKVVVEIRHL